MQRPGAEQKDCLDFLVKVGRLRKSFLEDLPSNSDVLPDQTRFTGGQRCLMYLNCNSKEDAEEICDSVDGKLSKEIGHETTKTKVRAVLKCDLASFRAAQSTPAKVSVTRIMSQKRIDFGAGNKSYVLHH